MGLGFGLRFWAQVLGFGFRTVALAAALTTHCCSLLLNAAQDTWRRARRARGAEQRRHGVGPASGTMLVGVAVVAARRRRSMLCSPDSSRPCRSTTSCVAVRERQVPHHPRYRPSVSDTEPVSRDTPPVSQIPDTPPVSQIPGWYPSRSLPHRTGGSRHQSHNTLLLHAAQVTEGGAPSSTVSSVSRSGTRWGRVAPCRHSRCGDRRRRCSRDSSRPCNSCVL